MNNKRVEEIISIVVDILINHLDNFKLYLFGSRSKDSNLEHSDIDLAIETECRDALVEKAKNEIDEIDTLYSVDIVNLNKVDQDFKELILKSGKIIYEK